MRSRSSMLLWLFCSALAAFANFPLLIRIADYELLNPPPFGGSTPGVSEVALAGDRFSLLLGPSPIKLTSGLSAPAMFFGLSSCIILSTRSAASCARARPFWESASCRTLASSFFVFSSRCVLRYARLATIVSTFSRLSLNLCNSSPFPDSSYSRRRS